MPIQKRANKLILAGIFVPLAVIIAIILYSVLHSVLQERQMVNEERERMDLLRSYGSFAPLLAAYHMDGTATDSTGNYDGILHDVSSSSDKDDVPDAALSGKGQEHSSYISFTSPIIPTGDKTIMFWVRFNSFNLPDGADSIIANSVKAGLDNVNGVFIYRQGENLQTVIGNGETPGQYLQLTSHKVLANDVWYDVWITQCGSALSVYIDGELDGSTTTVTGQETLGDTGLYLFYGQDPIYHYEMDGSLDELLIYSACKNKDDLAKIAGLFNQWTPEAIR